MERLMGKIVSKPNLIADDNLNAIDRTLYRHSNFGALEPCLLLVNKTFILFLVIPSIVFDNP